MYCHLLCINHVSDNWLRIYLHNFIYSSKNPYVVGCTGLSVVYVASRPPVARCLLQRRNWDLHFPECPSPYGSWFELAKKDACGRFGKSGRQSGWYTDTSLEAPSRWASEIHLLPTCSLRRELRFCKLWGMVKKRKTKQNKTTFYLE